MESKKINISKLKLNTGQVKGLPKNPRFIKDAKFEKLKNSIKEDPEMLQLRELIAYDNKGELVVIAGNMRLRALRDLGEKTAYVKILPTETESGKLRAYAAKDNIGYGQWDFELLLDQWNTDILSEWGIDGVEDVEMPEVISGEFENSQNANDVYGGNSLPFRIGNLFGYISDPDIIEKFAKLTDKIIDNVDDEKESQKYINQSVERICVYLIEKQDEVFFSQ